MRDIFFAVRLARPVYVDALAKAAAHLSRHRRAAAASEAHAESYEKALARAASRGHPLRSDHRSQ